MEENLTLKNNKQELKDGSSLGADTSNGSSANWHIVGVYSGTEYSARDQINEKVRLKSMSHLIEEILIPTEKVVEISGNKKVEKVKICMPGYIFIKMHLNDDLWHVIKGVPRVTGFIGSQTASVVSQEEIDRIMNHSQKSYDNQKPQCTFKIGDYVNVIDGPFASFGGFIEAIENNQLKISITVFGRQTPVTLTTSEVELG